MPIGPVLNVVPLDMCNATVRRKEERAENTRKEVPGGARLAEIKPLQQPVDV
jgi:hypothetical protein